MLRLTEHNEGAGPGTYVLLQSIGYHSQLGLCGEDERGDIWTTDRLVRINRTKLAAFADTGLRIVLGQE